MKKGLLFIFLLTGLHLQAQVSNEQWTIITKKSADWCTNCGGWAWPVFEDIQEDLKDKNAITLLMHHTGGLTNPAAAAITDNLGGVYQPEFFLNNDIQNIGPSNSAQKRMEIIEQVDLLSSLSAFGGVDLDAYVDQDGTTLKINADVEFFDNLASDFYLGLYLIQTNIMHNQANQGFVVQPRLLTDHITDDIFGDSVEGVLGVQNMTYDYTLPDTWALGEIEVVAIIWLKDTSGTYRVFNAKAKNDIQALLSSNDLVEFVQDFKTSINNNLWNMDIDVLKAVDNAKLSLVSMDGKLVYSTHSSFNEGKNSLQYDVPALSKGIYVASIEVNGKLVTEKVLNR